MIATVENANKDKSIQWSLRAYCMIITLGLVLGRELFQCNTLWVLRPNDVQAQIWNIRSTVMQSSLYVSKEPTQITGLQGGGEQRGRGFMEEVGFDEASMLMLGQAEKTGPAWVIKKQHYFQEIEGSKPPGVEGLRWQNIPRRYTARR